MSEKVRPIPTSHLPDTAGEHTSGEGAQTALAAMIRKRKMGENHVEVESADVVPKPIPGL